MSRFRFLFIVAAVLAIFAFLGGQAFAAGQSESGGKAAGGMKVIRVGLSYNEKIHSQIQAWTDELARYGKTYGQQHNVEFKWIVNVANGDPSTQASNIQDLINQHVDIIVARAEDAAAGTIPGSGDYAIDALSDQPPVVRFEQPAHDVQVTSVEELYTEAEAQDDYGVAHLDLVYRVNGGPERTVALGPGGAHKDVVGSYTFELEDLGLKPGDLVAYYARAREADHVGGAQEATSDIYFMQVRPFDRSYKAADAQGGGASGQNASAGALSPRGRGIVAGTVNLIRGSASYRASAHRANPATLGLAPRRLRKTLAWWVARVVARSRTGRVFN